jgi:hypothetical protein
VWSQTLSYVHCNLEGCFAPGHAYVALSRAATLDGLYVTGLSAQRVIASETVKRFHREQFPQRRDTRQTAPNRSLDVQQDAL